MSRCNDQSHASARWLHVLAPDLSDLRVIGRNELGTWANCPWCSTTLLIAAPPPAPRAEALGVQL